jgi:molybdenum-dependent DNA-binding transcriptional regulator ModE
VTTDVRSGIGLNYWAADHMGSLYRHAVETVKTMARLLAEIKAEIRTNQTKADADLNDIKEELKNQPRKNERQPRKDGSQDRGQ